MWSTFFVIALAARPQPAPPLAETATLVGKAAALSPAPFEELTELCDTIGHRLSGSANLERAIVWGLAHMKADGLNAWTEAISVPTWTRGAERGVLLDPISRPLDLMALGGTIGTPPGGLTAEVVVVDDWDHLARLGEAVAGKIVLFDVPFTDYGTTVAYRGRGAIEAARLGAVGALVRSVTPVSLATPHTGAMYYADDVPRIPSAALSVEHATLIRRLSLRSPVRVQIELGAATQADRPSANVVGQVTGREKPDEIVLLGCHLDSWDVGTGAQDDGAGCVLVLEALARIRALPVAPRRTVRGVLFTNEENGLRGGKGYASLHANERHVAAIEADTGAGTPLGFHIDAGLPEEAQVLTPELAQALAPLAALLAPYGATAFSPGGSGADVGPTVDKGGVLGMGLSQDMSTYWPIHHTEADTIDKVDPAKLSANAAVMTIAAYWLAETPTLPAIP